MFGLFKAKNPYEQAALTVYGTMLERARHASFYKELGIEDSFEGRFECLCVHIFMIMHVVLEQKGDEAFNQALFDIMFADMDQALRETGKGDMGVPKHMRRMMKGFNGRMHVYHEAYDDKRALEDALARNLYEGAEGAPVKKMASYVRKVVKALEKQGAEDIVKGRVSLPAIGRKGANDE